MKIQLTDTQEKAIVKSFKDAIIEYVVCCGDDWRDEIITDGPRLYIDETLQKLIEQGRWEKIVAYVDDLGFDDVYDHWQQSFPSDLVDTDEILSEEEFDLLDIENAWEHYYNIAYNEFVNKNFN